MESVTGDDCFRMLDLEQPVLFYFAAGWCKPCQESGPVVDKLIKDYDSNEIRFFKVDMVNEDNREFIQKCDVFNIPSFVLFKNREYVERIVGADIDGIKNLIEYHALGRGVNKILHKVIGQEQIQPPEPEIEDFYPNDTFQGEYEGFVFKNGPKGVGYYLDEPAPAPAPAPAATNYDSNTTGDGKTIDIHMVYGDWCGHSRNALPAFKELVPRKDIKTATGAPVSFILTDDKGDGMKRFREGDPPVLGFPTYMIVKPDGKMQELEGHDRSKDSIIEAVKAIGGIKKSNYTSNTTGDGKTVDIHMVYGGWCGHSRNALPAFEELVPMKDVTTSAGSPVSFILTEDKSDEMKRFREGEPRVTGFPTYMVVKPDGTMEKLQGHDRSKDSIISAAKALTI